MKHTRKSILVARCNAIARRRSVAHAVSCAFGGRHLLRFGGFSLLTAAWCATSLWAQTAGTALKSSAPLAPFVASDTTRNITGYLETGAESTPETCLAAIQLVRLELDRRPYQDTLAPAVQLVADTLPSRVRAIGMHCRTTFSTQTIPAQYLNSLLALAIQLGDSSLAATTAARWITAPKLQPTDRQESPLLTKLKRLLTAIQMYLTYNASELTFPATLASVNVLVHQLDALGAPARQMTMDARGAILLAQLGHAIRMGQWQPAQVSTLVLDFLRRSDAASPADRPNMGLRWALMAALMNARGFSDPHGLSAWYDSLCATSPTVSAFNTTSIRGRTLGQQLHAVIIDPFAVVGQLVAPLRGTYWYHAPTITAAGTTWPQMGHVSLLIRVANGLNLNQAAMIRRLAAQYGSKGLSITLVTKTHGYWLKNGSKTGPVSPAEEAAHDSVYYLDYLHLPVTLVVDSTTFVRDNEGRLQQAAPLQYESAYGQGNGAILVDRTGHMIWIGPDGARLSAYVARAVGQ